MLTCKTSVFNWRMGLCQSENERIHSLPSHLPCNDDSSGGKRTVQDYGIQNGMLFNPYCGSGTSLVEAVLNGMNAVGTDINPTARLLAEVKDWGL